MGYDQLASDLRVWTPETAPEVESAPADYVFRMSLTIDSDNVIPSFTFGTQFAENPEKNLGDINVLLVGLAAGSFNEVLCDAMYTHGQDYNLEDIYEIIIGNFLETTEKLKGVTTNDPLVVKPTEVFNFAKNLRNQQVSE